MLSIKKFDPVQLANEKAVATQLDRMDIAVEAIIANMIAVNYSEIMQNVDDGILPTSHSIIPYLKGKNGSGGLIEEYRSEYPNHFEGFVWSARNINEYIGFLATRLTSTRVEKSMRNRYALGFKNENWYNAFVALAGMLILEAQVKKGATKSQSAYFAIRFNLSMRELRDSMSAMCGRVAKNNRVTQYEMRWFKDLPLSFVNESSQLIKKQLESKKEEMDLIAEFAPHFSRALEQTRLTIE